MASDAIKEVDVRYLNKDFQGFKRDLMQYAKVHFSSSLQDYNETSPGMMLLELQAYVGDVLSYYLDQQFNEMKLQTAQQTNNIVDISKMMGYKPQGPRAASTVESFFVEVPSTFSGSQYVPDYRYAPKILPYARLISTDGVTFETNDAVDFSKNEIDSPLTYVASKFDENTNKPTHFALRKEREVYAGKTMVDTVTTDTAFSAFLRIELTQPDVIEVISVVDADNNTWYEVDYLSQDSVIIPVQNSADDSDNVPYVIKFLLVPRRFITDRDVVSGKTSLQFGSGDGIGYDDEIIPNIADMALPIPARGHYTGFTLDPQNFLKTTSLGMSPFGTTLTITYRVGGGQNTNVSKNTITSVESVLMDFSSNAIDETKKNEVISSLEVTNTKNSEGGGPAESISEIKSNATSYFASQGRCVTREDYVSQIMAMPAKFGRPEKVFVVKDVNNPLSLNIHILAKDVNGNLTIASQTLKKNVALHLKKVRMLTDAINILDGNIINIGINFGIVVSTKHNRVSVLAKCLDLLKQYFDVDRMQIGQPIIKSEVESMLQNIEGVISVYNLEFTNLFGTVDGLEYSDVRYDMKSMKNGILYCPHDSVFEVKNPNVDIVGETK